MTATADTDLLLEGLYEDLRAQLSAVNDLYHPVYPASPARIAELDAHIAELRASIAARKAALRAASPA